MNVDDGFQVRVVRSRKRKKTISGKLVEGNVVEIRAPASMSDEELRPFIERILKGFRRDREREKLSDEELEKRANRLNEKYFGGTLRWNSIRWSTRQDKIFGSCTPDSKTIRISYRLAKTPTWVLDYVIMHELTHLLEPNHGRRFWRLVNRYPLTERARGYLIALGFMDED